MHCVNYTWFFMHYINYCSCSHASLGPLARYVKLRVAHAPGMPGTFSLSRTSKTTNLWLASPAGITARASHAQPASFRIWQEAHWLNVKLIKTEHWPNTILFNKKCLNAKHLNTKHWMKSPFGILLNTMTEFYIIQYQTMTKCFTLPYKILTEC